MMVDAHISLPIAIASSVQSVLEYKVEFLPLTATVSIKRSQPTTCVSYCYNLSGIGEWCGCGSREKMVPQPPKIFN